MTAQIILKADDGTTITDYTFQHIETADRLDLGIAQDRVIYDQNGVGVEGVSLTVHFVGKDKQ